MRDTKFSILKALAIIFVVISHAGVTGYFFNFVYLFHVPAFFLCAGYFFHTKYLSDERTFIVHRIKGLYLPFLRWSVFFLIIHNLLFYLGILSETYGNAEGGVTHPFTFHQFSQHLWNIVFNMSGYDQFLCGTFWFFRALLLASIGFLILFKLLKLSHKFQSDRQIGWAILLISLALTTWKVSASLHITGIAQGGYRELMGISFMAIGFLLHQYEVTKWLTWRIVVPSILILVIFSVWCPTSMTWSPTFSQFAALPLPAIAGFFGLLYLSTFLNKKDTLIRRTLIFIGDNTLYIFAFHFVAFKLVSAIKVAWYGLPWQAIGGHPIVHQPANNFLWTLLYIIVGVAVPILWIIAYRKFAKNITFTQKQAINFCITYSQNICHVFYIVIRAVCLTFIGACRSFIQGIKDIIAASSTKDE